MDDLMQRLEVEAIVLTELGYREVATLLLDARKEIERLGNEAESLRHDAATSASGTRTQLDETAELRAALDAVAPDKSLLDWMDANGFSAYRPIDPIDGLAKHCVVVHETMRPRRGHVADTIREAIGAAIKHAGG